MNQKDHMLGTKPIGRLLLSLAIPAILAQVVNILYNIVDRLFIGRLPNGEVAIAGLGIALPILIIISSFSSLIGAGAAPLIAIKLGEKDNDGAEKILTNSFIALFCISFILTTFFMVVKEPLLIAFGATDATIGYATDYLSIYLLGTTFVQIALGLNPSINAQGFAKIGMATVMVGAITNIILDPIFIFGLNMGVKGAALATIIGQLLSFIWVICFLFGKKTLLRLRKKYIIPEKRTLLKIMSLGVTPFSMHIAESSVILIINIQLLKYGGDLAISVMAIIASVVQLVFLPVLGLAQGAQPIMGFNYGAKNMDRVTKVFKILFISSLTFSVLMWVIIQINPEGIARMFNNNTELVNMASWAIKIYFGAVFVQGIQSPCQHTFLALGQAKISLILSMLKKVILLIPLVLVLPNILDNQLAAVFLAQPIAEVVSVIITGICFYRFYKRTFKTKEL